jgi:DNA-binding NarL/FixJ family response regulator
MFARGLSSGAIALESNWSARTIRNRRRIAIEEVRRALADD